jgi:hypothetical protein
MLTAGGRNIASTSILLAVGIATLFSPGCSRLFRPPAAQFADGGSATSEELKTPLQGSVLVQRHGDTVLLSLKLTDAKGRAIQTLYSGRSRPPAPKVDIFNEQGNQIYSCKLEYG